MGVPGGVCWVHESARKKSIIRSRRRVRTLGLKERDMYAYQVLARQEQPTTVLQIAKEILRLEGRDAKGAIKKDANLPLYRLQAKELAGYKENARQEKMWYMKERLQVPGMQGAEPPLISVVSQAAQNRTMPRAMDLPQGALVH